MPRNVLLAFLLCWGCSQTPATPGPPDMRFDPLAPVPECRPGELLVKPLMGDRQLVFSSFKIADYTEGFDLNGDGKPDNKLAVISTLANASLKTAFDDQHNIILPLELFGYTGKDSDCTKLAIYLGRVNEDKDQDGALTSWEAGKADCDDTRALAKPSLGEMTNRMDDDCDGYADNVKGSPPSDKQDLDGDGYTLAMGDCDDRKDVPVAALRHPGALDSHCGSGVDFNCDGLPDNDVSCDPFGDNKVPLHVQSVSFAGPMGEPLMIDAGVTDAGANQPVDVSGHPPLLVFPDGQVKNGVFHAGPDRFHILLTLTKFTLDLTLTGAHVSMKLVDKPIGTYVTPQGGGNDPPHGIIGGVIEANTLAQVKGLSSGEVIHPEQSLLDAIFAGPGATLAGLESDDKGHYLPDIDVDGDGLESFWQEGKAMPGPDGGAPLVIVDRCRDGDGTIVKNDFDGKGTICALAKDSHGKYRFVDGLSLAIKFAAVPVKLVDVVVK